MGKREAEGCGQIMLVFVYLTLWALALKAPLSMGFFRQENWSGLSFPPPGDLCRPGTEPSSPRSPELHGDNLLSHQGSPIESECCLLYQ